MNQTFFATSHGKSPCDGIGGTVKQLVTRASLQWPISNQILTADKIFKFCVKQIKGIDLLFLKNQEIGNIRANMDERYKWHSLWNQVFSSIHSNTWFNYRCKICFRWSVRCCSVWLQYCSFTWARRYTFSFSVCCMFVW